MTIMTIRIPDAVAAAFDKAFEGEDKDVIVTAALLRLTEEKVCMANEVEKRARKRGKAVDAILELRKKFPALSNEEIRNAREEGRP